MRLPSTDWKRKFRRRLRAWFDRHARKLPWRETRDPYHTWVSEIMLQQTQVATVIPYFERFLKSFPTIGDLAEASEERVLSHWEGLGYYRRARQLHSAAKVIAERYGGEFPRDRDAVLALPGVGRYTAGAILSIAFDAREPILEANTIRLYSRLLAYAKNPLAAEGQTLLWEFAEAVLPRQGAGDFNQALMDLGSLICTPKTPHCGNCPVESLCATAAAELQGEIPARQPRMKYEAVNEVCVVVWRDERVLLRRCGETERWAGLWDFPRFPVDGMLGAGPSRDHQLVANVKRLTGVTIVPGEEQATIKHGVTRFRITLVCYHARYDRGAIRGEVRWVPATELGGYPLSVTGRKIARSL